MDAETELYWKVAYSDTGLLSPYEGIDWSVEITKERELRKCVSALDPDNTPTAEQRETIQAWYKHVTFMLRYCVYHSRLGKLEETSPAEMLDALALVTDFLSRGLIPPFVSGVVSQGAPPRYPGELVAIGWASAYINGCRIKKINDKSHIKTICEVYSIQEPTAFKWGRLRLPEILEGRVLTPELVTRSMRVEGGRYSLYGRSFKAIDNRGPQK